jgi:lipopolysaccharide export system protein LptA
VKNGEDQIHGDYIWYDATSQRYLATKGDTGLKQPARVRAMIQPKKKGAPPAEAPSQPSSLQLKGAESITPPEHP